MLRRSILGVGALLVVVLVVVGLRGTPSSPSATGASGPAPSAEAIRRAYAGAPAPLAAVHAQANRLLRGGRPAFRARLRELRGTPVVLNKWSSTCGPCRAEFGVLRTTALRYARRVAFLGLDANDLPQGGPAFLRRFPLPYPSYEDPREQLSRGVGAPRVQPITVFIDARGRRTAHAGAYPDEARLVADVERYALAR